MSLLSVLRSTDNLHRSYMLRFADSLITTTLTFAIPVIIYSVTHSIKWSGISFMLEWLPRLTAIPTAGPFVDRFGPRRVFLFTNSVRGILAFALVGALAVFPHAWWLIVLFGIAAGMMAQASFVAAEHLGMTLAEGRTPHRVQSVQVGIDQVVLVLGPLLGGVLLAVHTMAVFLVVAIMASTCVALAWRLSIPTAPREAVQQFSIIKDIRSGMRILVRNPTLVYLTIGVAGTNLLFALLITITPAFVGQRYGLGNGSVSLIWTVGALCSVVAVALTDRFANKWGILRIGIVASIASCLAMLFVAISSSYVMYSIGAAIFIAMDGAGTVFIRTVRMKLIPKQKYGVVISAMVLALLAPYPIVGVLVAIVPFAYIGLLVEVSAIITLAVMVRCFMRMDRLALQTDENSAPISRDAVQEGA